jgi:hypothetical protein
MDELDFQSKILSIGNTGLVLLTLILVALIVIAVREK